jgi:nitrogen fixation/metabolism regulation signal transduction histidine kinase
VRYFDKASIRRKQMLIIMLTTSIALVLACAAFAVYEVLAFRKAMVQNVSTLAQMIGDNSAAALDFNDSKSAEETLASLKAEPSIAAARIYSKQGEAFARYDRPGGGVPSVPPKFQTNGYSFDRRRLALFTPIGYKGESIGVIYLESDLRALYSRLVQYAAIAAGVFLLTLLVAYLISNRLQRVITEPILELVKTARAVAQEKDYSMRVTRRSEDEIGVLIEGFNEMLAQIQSRDVVLQTAHSELEKRVQERTQELANSLSLIRATLESAADGILVTDESGKVTHFNQPFIAIFRIPEEIAARRDRGELLDFIAADIKQPKEFRRIIETIGMHPTEDSFDQLEFTDGRVLERYSKPQWVNEKAAGRVWSFRDITERRRAEVELKKTHSELMDASRRAGMAEVATGVLHNVGNVLNSVNVSANVASDHIRKSKVKQVARVAEMLREHAGDLGDFMVNDTKGRQLPSYLEQLAEHLAAEQTLLLTELRSLQNNIEHIKDIVSVQQSYARVSGLTETLNVVDLVEDALRMNTASLARHAVPLFREYEPELPMVIVEKQKVLQILVNLIRNAKYACDETGSNDKRITVRVYHKDSRMRIAIIDNGVGIPAENLLRIFNHGFTTRKTGHGFGLHSGALAAKELGGSLEVHSDGPGKGATFTLEFPCQPKTSG